MIPLFKYGQGEKNRDEGRGQMKRAAVGVCQGRGLTSGLPQGLSLLREGDWLSVFLVFAGRKELFKILLLFCFDHFCLAFGNGLLLLIIIFP